MKQKNYKLIAIIMLAAMLSNIGAVLAREKENVSVLASFKEALSDFRQAKEEFEDQEKTSTLPNQNLFEELKNQIKIAPEIRFEKVEPIGGKVTEAPAPAVTAVESKTVKLIEKAAEAIIERNKEILDRVRKQQEIYKETENLIVPAVKVENARLQTLKSEIRTAKPEAVKKATASIKTSRESLKQIELKKAIIVPHLIGFEMGPLKVAAMRKEKIAATLDELEKQGKDTNAPEIKIKEAEAKLALIKADLNQLKNEVSKPTLKAELERLRDEIKLVYKIFEEVAILAKAL